MSQEKQEPKKKKTSSKKKVTKKVTTKKKATKKKTAKRVTTKNEEGVVIDQIQNPELQEVKNPPELEAPKPIEKKKRPKGRRLLTDKQKIFCDEYIKTLNKSEAAIKAGYSPKSAGQVANETFKNPNVTDYIQKRMNKRAKRTEITQDKVVEEIAKIAFSDMRNVATWGGGNVTFLESDDLTDDVTAAISEISSSYSENSNSMKVKFYDKLRALDMLGRHLNLELSKQKSEVELTGTLNLKKLEDKSDEELLALLADDGDDDGSE